MKILRPIKTRYAYAKWWLLRLHTIVTDLPHEVSELRTSHGALKAQVKEMCKMHVDVHRKSPTQIIIVGKLNEADYVRIFELPKMDLRDLIEHMSILERENQLGYIDTAPGMASLIRSAIAEKNS